MQRKIRVDNPTHWRHHRSGWGPCIRRLREDLGTPDGVLCIGAEDHVRWPPGGRPIDEPFILISHFVPIGHPRHRGWNLTDFARNPAWLRCRDRCLGVIALSSYACEHARRLLGVPCDYVFHATEHACVPFSMERFLSAPRRELVMVGTWMRRFATLADLRAPGFAKRLLHGGLNCRAVRRLFESEGRGNSASQYLSQPLVPEAYDELVSRCILLLDLFDASANNAVLDCIVRRTPILVRRLPAIVEYLGADYPLYFETLEEAESKLRDDILLERAQRHLERPAIQEPVALSGLPRKLAHTAVYAAIGSKSEEVMCGPHEEMAADHPSMPWAQR